MRTLLLSLLLIGCVRPVPPPAAPQPEAPLPESSKRADSAQQTTPAPGPTPEATEEELLRERQDYADALFDAGVAAEKERCADGCLGTKSDAP